MSLENESHYPKAIKAFWAVVDKNGDYTLRIGVRGVGEGSWKSNRNAFQKIVEDSSVGSARIVDTGMT